MNEKIWIIILFVISISYIHCQPDTKNCKLFNENSILPIAIERTEKELMKITSVSDFQSFVKKYPQISKKFFAVEQYPISELFNRLETLIKNPYFDTLYQETNKTYPHLKSLKSNLSFAFNKIQSLDTTWKVPDVQTAITGFAEGCDLGFYDNTILIGLDWFLDKNAKYSAPNQPLYILDRYTPKHLSSAILLMLSDLFNKTDLNDKTLLSQMISFGKAYQFVHSLQPCVSDSIILGYNTQQMIDINHNQEIIWSHFLDNQLFFSTKQDDIRDYISEAPTVHAIGNKCPGRIGRWLGWELVRNYMQKNNISLKDLLNETDAQKILKLSNYHPQKNR